MRKFCLTSIALIVSVLSSARDLQPVRFMPAWIAQAQFAGYYAAKELGFYSEAGLDVEIVPRNPNSTESNILLLQEGYIDVTVSNPLKVLNEGQRGKSICNALQIAQVSSMAIVCRHPVGSLEDLNGLRIGRWKDGYGDVCEIFCKTHNVDVQWIPFLSGINLIIAGAIDAMTCMTFNELLSLEESLGSISDANVIRLVDYGYMLPEDGVYFLKEYTKDHPDRVDAFCEATKKGWLWCMDHRSEALDIVMDYAAKDGVRTNKMHQRRMLDEMLRIMANPKNGEMDFQMIEKTVFDKYVLLMKELNFISRVVSYEEFCR